MAPAASVAQALREAMAALNAGHLDQATLKARQLVEANPGDAEAQHVLGLSLMLSGQVAEALPALEGALRIDPDEPRYAFSMGMALNRLGRRDGSISAYRHALSLRPRHVETMVNLAAVLHRIGQFQEAAEHYAAAVEIRPGQAPVLNALGLCQLHSRQPEAAERSFAAAIEVDQGFADAHFHRSLALMRLERRQEALSSIRDAIRLQPRAADFWFNLGEYLYLQGALTEAREAFERVLSLNPNDEVARHRLSAIKGEHVERPPDAYVRAMFDGFAPTFDERLVETLDYDVPRKMVSFLGPWRSGKPPQLHVLDLGCGTGLSGLALRPISSELVGVDLAAEMLKRARERGLYDALHEASLVDFLAQQMPERWDLVVALDVFIYVGKLDDVFQAVASALRPGGLFAFSVELPDQERDGFSLQQTARYAHSRAYLQAAAAQAGLIPWGTEQVELRKEGGRPLVGLLAAFTKSPHQPIATSATPG